ncbi:MAG: hypothetical protein AB1714_17115 [Acidobacteriota bacterium]
MFGTSSLLIIGLGLGFCGATVLPYLVRYRLAEKRAREKLQKTAIVGGAA